MSNSVHSGEGSSVSDDSGTIQSGYMLGHALLSVTPNFWGHAYTKRDWHTLEENYREQRTVVHD